jgi:HlyD family secretion protein
MSNPEASSIESAIGLDPASNRRRALTTWVVVGGGILFLVLFIAYFVMRGGPGGPTYVTEPLERGDLTVTVSAVGELAPLNQVDVGTEVSGTIEEVLVDNNDRVTAGQLLARLNTDQLDAQVRRARATLVSAEARVGEAEATIADARRTRDRTEELRGRGVATQEALDTARSTYDRAVATLASARAQVEVAAADLAAAETSLSKAEIFSPVDGVVLDRKVDPGMTVVAAMQTPILFTLAEDLAQMELKVAIDEADVGQVLAGQPAVFTVDAYPNRRFPAQITRVRFNASTLEGVVTYETLLSVDNSGLLLRPGMTASAVITVAVVEDALLAPNEALRWAPDDAEAPRRARVRVSTGEGSGEGSADPGKGREGEGGEGEGGEQRAGEVWTLVDGEPKSFAVTIGPSDGTQTVVSGAEIAEGDAVIIDTEIAL